MLTVVQGSKQQMTAESGIMYGGLDFSKVKSSNKIVVGKGS